MSRTRPEAAASLDARGAFLLSQLGSHVAERCAELLAPLDLHPAHYGVLYHLSTADGSTQQELADRLGIHRNVMVGLIDALQERELVRRERCPADRRAYQLHLTERAKWTLAAASSVLDGLENEVLAPLNAAERGRLIALLDRLAAHGDLPAGVHPGIRRRGGTEARPVIRPT